MQEQRAGRGPRGKYARLICHACRSRKIKCVLPCPDEIGPLGVPQATEKSCERCRSFNLKCIVDRTVLGRPASKRARPRDPGDSGVQEDGNVTTPSNLEIHGYIYSEAVDGSSIVPKNDRPNTSKPPSKQDIFQSMVESSSFFASILANDEAFGSAIPHATSRFNTPLPDLVGNDLAASLDESLTWHRFFLPQMPTLVSIRARLTSDEFAFGSHASNLLFALLCWIALEASGGLARKHRQLTRSLQLAVSAFGQKFLVDPPIHRDSIVVSLLLADYKPAALVSSQTAAHLAVKSQLYIHLAYRIAERLELLPTQASLRPIEADTTDSFDLERWVLDSLQGIRIYCFDALLDGFLMKPFRAMRQVLGCMKPHIEMYREVLRHHPCPPRIIYHLQSMTGTYIFMEALADVKQHWNNLDSLSAFIESAQEKCLDQIGASHAYLADSSDFGKQDELSAVSSLLKLRFHSVSSSICAMGLLYGTVLKTRGEGQTGQEGPEIHSHEAIQIGDQVVDSFKNTSSSNGRAQSILAFLKYFGTPYPKQLEAILERFIDCADNLRLDGIAFQPPPRLFALEVVSHCKNIVENNIIQLKAFGELRPDFEKHLEVFAKCSQRLETMVAPGSSIDAAFAGGCVYAACSKLIQGLRELMESLRTRLSSMEDEQKQPGTLEVPVDAHIFDGMETDFSFEGLDFWPHVGGFDFAETLEDQSDLFSTLNLFPELESGTF